MNFQTMHKQRKFLLIASVIGFISMFLPWMSVSILGMSNSVNGMHGWGILGFFCFVACGLIAIYGNQAANLDKNLWIIALVAGVIALVIPVVFYLNMANSFMGSSFVGFGVYISALAALMALFSTWVFKSPGDTLKNGFDGLKTSFEQKFNAPASNTATPPPSPPSAENTTTEA